MSKCCGEWNCRRKQPLALYLGEFSGTVYAVTRWTYQPPTQTSEHRRAVERHDITAQMRGFIGRNPEWVRAVLAAAGAENVTLARYADSQ